MMANASEQGCNQTYTTMEKNILLILAGSSAAISFCMCVIAVSLVLCLKLYRIFTYRLATYQVLAGMMFSFGATLFFGVINYNSNILAYVIVCKTQAFVTTYFMWVKLLFTMNLVFHLLCLAVFMKNFKNFELFYILFSTLFPLLFTWIPFIHDNYDVAGAWCWIRDWKDNCATKHYLEGIIEQFAMWFVPLTASFVIAIVIVIVIFVVILLRMCSYSDESEPLLPQESSLKWRQKKILWDLLPLLAYPIIFCVISLVPIINRVYDAIFNSPSYGLSVGHAVTIYLMGFFSATALITHILVAKFYKQKVTKYKNAGIPPNVINNHKSKKGENSTNWTTAYVIPRESEVDQTTAITAYVIPPESEIDQTLHCNQENDQKS